MSFSHVLSFSTPFLSSSSHILPSPSPFLSSLSLLSPHSPLFLPSPKVDEKPTTRYTSPFSPLIPSPISLPPSLFNWNQIWIYNLTFWFFSSCDLKIVVIGSKDKISYKLKFLTFIPMTTWTIKLSGGVLSGFNLTYLICMLTLALDWILISALDFLDFDIIIFFLSLLHLTGSLLL